MGKKRKLYNLRFGIMRESERARVVLEQIVNSDEYGVSACVLSEIALEQVKKISKMNEKIGMILKH